MRGDANSFEQAKELTKSIVERLIAEEFTLAMIHKPRKRDKKTGKLRLWFVDEKIPVRLVLGRDSRRSCNIFYCRVVGAPLELDIRSNTISSAFMAEHRK